MERISIMTNASTIMVFFLLSNLIVTQELSTFTSVKDVIAYANKYNEYPMSDLDLEGKLAQINPTFYQFYPTIDPGLLKRISCNLNILRPLWCFSDFINAMQHIYEHEGQREWNTQATKQDGSQQTNLTTVIGCSYNEHSNFIIIGDLSGGFHSLARITAHWHAIGLIDEQFNLKDENVHIIFIGNVIGSSAYNLETLTLLGIMHARNLNNIWYLCGANEDRQRWHETPLYHAVTVRSRLNRNARRAAYKLIDDVFSFLPDAFMITSKDHKQAIVCSASQVFENITPSAAAKCIQKFTPDSIQGCGLAHNSGTSEEYTVLSLIETRRTWDTVFVTPPLEKIALPAIKGPVWDIVSGTTRGLRAIYRVRWNGYLMLKPRGEHLENSTLEYIGRRIDFDDTFKSRETYNAITGELISKDQNPIQTTEALNSQSENTIAKKLPLK
jgi:hypothetical protein